MEGLSRQWNVPEGTDVCGSEGDKIGEVVAMTDRFVVVEKGFFFPTDYYVPTSALANFEDNKLYLNVTKEEALNSGWDQEPSDWTSGATGRESAFTPLGNTDDLGTTATLDDASRAPIAGMPLNNPVDPAAGIRYDDTAPYAGMSAREREDIGLSNDIVGQAGADVSMTEREIRERERRNQQGDELQRGSMPPTRREGDQSGSHGNS